MLRSFTRLTDAQIITACVLCCVCRSLSLSCASRFGAARSAARAKRGPISRLERHAGDHLSIAADPYETPKKASIFRVNYVSANIIPIRIIITNEGDTPISLDNARIDFITAAGDKVPAAEPRDAERAIDRPADPRNKIPIGPIKVGGKGKNQDKKIEQDFSEFQYNAIAVEPHTTRAGFLFYDLQDLENPLRGCAPRAPPHSDSRRPRALRLRDSLQQVSGQQDHSPRPCEPESEDQTPFFCGSQMNL